MSKGKLIVFEGIDGCGKTTQINMLEEYFKNSNIPVHVMSNISNGDLGLLMRKSLSDSSIFVNDLQIGLLFIAELFIVYEDIKKYLDQNINVICSRWWYSTLAYIGEEEEVFNKILSISKDIPEPDILIYLDVHPVISNDRINTRGEDKEIFEDMSKLEKVHMLYKTIYEFVAKTNKINIKVDGLTRDEIHEDIVNKIHTLM